jgi:hypothetical protein
MEVAIQGSVRGDNNPAFEKQRITKTESSCSFYDWSKTLEIYFPQESFIS